MLRYPKLLLTSFLALALTAPVSLAQDADSQNVGSHARMVRISYVEGTAQLNGERAVMNSPITEGAVLVTGSDGLAEVQFEDSSAIRMASETQITFAQLARLSSGEAITRADLDEGEAEFLIPASSVGRFAVDVHGKNVSFKEPGRFRILSIKSSPLEIAVWKGQASVRDRETGLEVSVKKNETFTLNPADPEQYDLESAVVADDLDQWSNLRDQTLNAALPSIYTSPGPYPSTYASSGGGYYYQPTYLYGFNDFGCYGYGFWQPLWFGGGPWNCWNSGFFFQPWFFSPPVVVVVNPIVRPHRPPFIRPPTVPTVASGGPVTAPVPGIQSLRFGGRVQRVFNDDNFQRRVPRVESASTAETANRGEKGRETAQGSASHPVAPLITPGQRSAGNASVAPLARVPSASPSSQAPRSSAPAMPRSYSPPPRSYSPPPRSYSPPPSSGPRGFSGGSVSHSSSSSSHSGGRR